MAFLFGLNYFCSINTESMRPLGIYKKYPVTKCRRSTLNNKSVSGDTLSSAPEQKSNESVRNKIDGYYHPKQSARKGTATWQQIHMDARLGYAFQCQDTKPLLRSEIEKRDFRKTKTRSRGAGSASVCEVTRALSLVALSTSCQFGTSRPPLGGARSQSGCGLITWRRENGDYLVFINLTNR